MPINADYFLGGGSAGGGGGFANKQVFETSQTFTVPDGVYAIGVEMVGGGGGGGRPDVNFAHQAGSGGGAGAGVKDILFVEPGEDLGIVIGAGGAGATTNSTAGSNGGLTSLNRPVGNPVISAGGGAGGFFNGTQVDNTITANMTINGVSLRRGAGTRNGDSYVPVSIGGKAYEGNATSFLNNIQVGIPSGTQGRDFDSTPGGGAGGSSYYSAGGDGGDSVKNGHNAQAGSAPPTGSYGGGGGGGGNTTGVSGTSGNGGDGANGLVILWY